MTKSQEAIDVINKQNELIRMLKYQLDTARNIIE